MAQAQPSPINETSETLFKAGRALLGAVLFLIPLFFWLGTHDQFELPKLSLLRLFTLALLACLVFAQALSPVIRLRRTPLDLPLLSWSLWLVVKTLHSVSPWVSWRGEYENFAGSLTQLNYSLLFWLTTQFIQNLDQARRLLLYLEASALAVAVYAIFQALGLDFVAWAATSVVGGRYFASMGNPNFLGALMVMALSLLLGRVFWGLKESSLRASWLHWTLLAILPLFWFAMYQLFPPGHAFKWEQLKNSQPGALWILGLHGLGLVAAAFLLQKGRLRPAQILLNLMQGILLFKALADTGTRGAFAGGLAVVAFFSLLAMRRLWLQLGIVAALILSSFTLGPVLRERMLRTLLHPIQAFDESRMQIWVPAVKIWRAFPLTGSGVDSFKTVFPQFQKSKFNRYDGENVSSRMAHSEPLQVLSTLGLIGFILWHGMLLAWALAVWRQWKEADPERLPLLSGLIALVLGYLVQNLFSFGVSAIAAPFFACLALPFAGKAVEWRKRTQAWALPAAFTLGLGLVFSAVQMLKTPRADALYSFGHMVNAQLASMERASMDEMRGAAAYALEALKHEDGALREESKVEQSFWLEKLIQLENQPRATAFDQNKLAPLYRAAAEPLLMLLSAMRQERAVALCPHEVKYRVYLGLAYEELFKRSAKYESRERWFYLAQASYAQGSRMNPRNAYYHGNLARLYSLKAGQGVVGMLDKAEAEYKAAIALGPVTALFYENLMLLYGEHGKPEASLALVKPLESEEKSLAARLYASTGAAYWQMSPSADKKNTEALKASAASLLARAQELDPGNPDVLYLQAGLSYSAGDKAKARLLIDEALKINPAHQQSLRLRQALP